MSASTWVIGPDPVMEAEARQLAVDGAALVKHHIAQMERLPAELERLDANPGELKDELLGLMRRAIEYHPRSLQIAIGPSEVGHPCARRLGYKLLGYEEKAGEPNWKATVGTAIHSWLEEVMLEDNPRQEARRAADASRWIVEATVSVGQIGGHEIDGHCDLFDRVTGTVVDWKTCGPTQLKKYRAKGPGSQYRAQAHLYGRGWVRRGQDVRTVAVMFLPRNGELREAVWWSEPYDEQIALDALARADGIHTLTAALGHESLPLLGTADAFCRMCPYYLAGSTDLTQGCPGDPGSARPPAPPALRFADSQSAITPNNTDKATT